MDESGFTGVFHFPSATPLPPPPPPHLPPIIKDDVFSNSGVWNFDPLDTKISKMLTKTEPFDFHCSKGADKYLRV